MDRFWTQDKLSTHLERFLKPSLYEKRMEIPHFRFWQSEPGNWEPGNACGFHLPSFDDSTWDTFHVGSTWGGVDVSAWFRTIVTVPNDFDLSRTCLLIYPGKHDHALDMSEALVYIDGKPLQGVDMYHNECWLGPENTNRIEENDRTFHLALKAWSGHWGAVDQRVLSEAALAVANEDIRYLIDNFSSALQAIALMPDTSVGKQRLLDALDSSYALLDMHQYKKEAYYHSAKAAAEHLRQQLEHLRQYSELQPVIHCIGHSHLDIAWKWRRDATIDKASRTFSTVLNMMDQYPDYCFLHSTPWVYEQIQTLFPDLFDRIQQRVKEGRWQVNGSMWCEADTIITGAESLIRQIMAGKAFVKKEFGVDNTVLWEPDVFGFSYALPQIMKKTGLTTLITSKLSWSQFNKFPYDTFYWKGMDGSQVLVQYLVTPEYMVTSHNLHLPSTYNSPLTPKDIAGAWDNYQQKNINTNILATYGHGDGGGGPTPEMVKTVSFFNNIPGMPHTHFARVENMLSELRHDLGSKKVPCWDNDLYFELHRGTYTSQSAIKRANKYAEVLYHNAEAASALSEITYGREYPADELEKGWKYILFNQFHDVLPGSSITQVNQEALADYHSAHVIGEKVLNTALEVTNIDSGKFLLYNGLGWGRAAYVKDEQGQTKFAGIVPSFGYLIPDTQPSTLSDANVSVSPNCMESRYCKLEFDEQGQITSFFDKINGRQVLPSGKAANAISVFSDMPMKFNAWDIDVFYQNKEVVVQELLECRVDHYDSCEGTLYFKWKIYDSTIEQKLTIYNYRPGATFDTTIDWHEHHLLLKTAFPTNIHSKTAICGTQFGTIERPTHWNTLYDFAKFEVPAHGFVDLSEEGYGAALMSDCKYGYDVHENVLRLTMLKSAVDPDPEADQGIHHFTYEFMPHTGSHVDAQIPLRACELANPILTLHSTIPTAGSRSLLHTSDSGVIVETIKKAEDGHGYIVRAYEWANRHLEQVKFVWAEPCDQVWECDMLENKTTPIACSGNQFRADFTPFEIKTFYISKGQ